MMKIRIMFDMVCPNCCRNIHGWKEYRNGNTYTMVNCGCGYSRLEKVADRKTDKSTA